MATVRKKAKTCKCNKCWNKFFSTAKPQDVKCPACGSNESISIRE